MIKVTKSDGMYIYNFYNMFIIKVKIHTEYIPTYFMGTILIIDNQNRAESLFTYKNLLDLLEGSFNKSEIISPHNYVFNYDSSIKTNPLFIKSLNKLLPIIDVIFTHRISQQLQDNYYQSSRYYVDDKTKEFQKEFLHFIFNVSNGNENKEGCVQQPNKE